MTNLNDLLHKTQIHRREHDAEESGLGHCHNSQKYIHEYNDELNPLALEIKQ